MMPPRPAGGHLAAQHSAKGALHPNRRIDVDNQNDDRESGHDRVNENGDLLHYVNDHRIPLECCPSSNVQTGAIRDLASHPLKLYKNLGLRVTVNTDNRLITDTTVSKELWLCHTQLGLSLKDIKQLILSGFKSAFLPFHVKQQYLRKVSEELAAFPDDEPLMVHTPTSQSTAPAPLS